MGNLFFGRLLPVSLLLLTTACQGTNPPSTQENPALIAPIPATPIPTSPPPTETLAPLPSATVIREDVILYEGPFGHVVDTTAADGGIRRQYENAVLRENLPLGMELQVIGQYSDCDVLNVILPDGTAGWVNIPSLPIGIHDDPNVSLSCDCSDIPEGIYRPWTGPLTRNFGARADSNLDQLFIENQTTSDVLIVLTDTDENLTDAAYVRAGDKSGLALMGEKVIYFALGEDWLVNSGRFRMTHTQLRTIETISKQQEWIILNQPGQPYTDYTLILSGEWIDKAHEGWVIVDKFPLVNSPAPFVITPGP